MENPIRDLPRVINSAMGIVLIGFVLMNMALYIVVPMDALRDQETVAVVRTTSSMSTNLFFVIQNTNSHRHLVRKFLGPWVR
jgi:amino acid transporter